MVNIRRTKIMRLLFILLFTNNLTLHVSFAIEKIPLKEILKNFEKENLDLKIEATKSNIASTNIAWIDLPPPTLGLGKMSNNLEIIEVTQNIPFPTKLFGNLSARSEHSKSQEEIYRSKISELTAETKLLYMNLWISETRHGLLLDKLKIINDHIKLASSTTRSDSFAGVHLLKAESYRDLLENEITQEEQMITEWQIKLAIQLNQDPLTYRFQTIEPPLSVIPQLSTYSESHQVNANIFALRSLKDRNLTAKSEWLPDFNLKYKRVSSTRLQSSSNEYMIGITLPFLFFWKPFAESKVSSLNTLKAEHELEKQKKLIQAEKSILLSKARSIKKQLHNINTKLIPRAEKRVKIIRNVAPRDMETLQDHRETMEAYPDLKLAALKLRLDYEETIAGLEKYLLTKELTHE